MSFWESQPVAYTRAGEPCFTFTLKWDDFRIRSLHPPHTETDKRAKIVRQQDERFAEAEGEQQSYEVPEPEAESWESEEIDFENLFSDELNFDDPEEWDSQDS